MSGRRLRNQRGSTLMELPLALIWVFTVMFALTESGRLVLAYTTLCDAARAGTRYAIVHGSYRTGACTSAALDGKAGPSDDPACVVRVVQNVATAAGLSAGSLVVQVRYPDDWQTVSETEMQEMVELTEEFGALLLPLLKR